MVGLPLAKFNFRRRPRNSKCNGAFSMRLDPCRSRNGSTMSLPGRRRHARSLAEVVSIEMAILKIQASQVVIQ